MIDTNVHASLLRNLGIDVDALRSDAERDAVGAE